jgi:EAL domain-containing protein (putative c-di-GMP-specific phosphodiesterase class I)
MYEAKANGKNGFSFFTTSLQEKAHIRLRMANDLRLALGRKQFHLVYQPIVELKTGHIRKAEALIRWNHPELGLIPPNDFIELAESIGLIEEIGEWVFQTAAQQVQEWRKSIDPQMQISVNKSPLQFKSDIGQTKAWADYLSALDLSPDAIVVEITEGLLLDATEPVQQQLTSLRDLGLQVSLDDFGTGYSSLSYLHRYDIDFLKIDQSFICDLQPDSKILTLCKAIIRMAHELGIKVIAEGVETQKQRDLMLDAGCDFGQGYYFSKPVVATEFPDVIPHF